MTNVERSPLEKRLLENLQNDLKLLSAEARKKHSHLKEAAESGIIKVRNASTKYDDLRLALLSESPEILEPFFMGCDAKSPKIVQICLTAIQRLITQEAVSSMAANNIITCLWNLMESGIEELKLLQTVTLLITTNKTVLGEALAKAIVLCFRLHFTKNSTTNNTASATVRQLVSAVFERVQVEDVTAVKDHTALDINLEELKIGSRVPPKSLPAHAADGFLLFQDLVQLVNADQPFWLVGLTEMTRTFGLELLESILSSFPEVFLKHPEFSFLLKERVCPLIIKLFSPNIKHRQGLQVPVNTISDKPYFPITMRLLRIVSVLIQKYYSMLITECEIFLSLIVKFLDNDKPQWQRAIALEVLHKMCIQPELLKSFCECYDMKPHSTKIFQDIVNALGSYVQSLFMTPAAAAQTLAASLSGGSSTPPSAAIQGQPPALVAGLPIGPGVSPQAGFLYRGVWLPIIPIPTGACKPVFIELLDKLEAPTVPDGYGISVAYACLLEIINSLSTVIDKDCYPTGSSVSKVVDTSQDDENSFLSPLTNYDKLLNCQIISSSWCGLLAAFTLLIDASTDETATENILKSIQVYSSICGSLNMTTPRDAFITAVCKASLPPHYTLTVLNAGLVRTDSKAHSRTDELNQSNINNASCINPVGQVPLGLYLGPNDGHDMRQQVVAVGTPLPTASLLPGGAQHGPVMLTSKNLQCMRAVLSLAHCHGSILGTAWHLVLTTLQHLVWILGLKPSTGGSLKASRSTDSSNAIITTAVMADLPVLSAMLSRLFESSHYVPLAGTLSRVFHSSQNLDDVALHHLIDALCKLSSESMELAYHNREPSLFAVAKLLETGIVNLFRVEVLWRPVTKHLLEVCQHPHIRMREWGAEAVTFLVKAALCHKYDPPLKENKKLQTMLLSPLQELSLKAHHPDIRHKQLECVLQVLHSSGDVIFSGWPQILDVIGAINEDHGETLIRSAFQCLQLVVADYPPLMPCTCLQLCVDTASKFGSQNQELNVSLAAIGLLWNIADHLFQNQEKLQKALNNIPEEELPSSSYVQISNAMNAVDRFDRLWMSLFCRLGDLCVDSRPAVRKSAGQTLFSTLGAHGSLLQQSTWQVVLWQVLFPLLDRVRSLSGTASADKITDMGGNILIHHSRNTAQKQWAETQVLTLSGVARIFHTKREVLLKLGDFPRAWALLLEFIESSSLSKNNEVSFSALKSFQEILNFSRYQEKVCSNLNNNFSDSQERQDIGDCEAALWAAAWKVWYNIGIESTKPPPDRLVDDANARNDLSLLYIPSQQFLTALVQIFPYLFQHIKGRFVASDFPKLAMVLQNVISVPIYGEAAPFILPSLSEVVLTPLQETVLHALKILQEEALGPGENVQDLLPVIFNQLLVFACYACCAPSYGRLKTMFSLKPSSTDWVTMNFVPFAEKSLEMAVNLYNKTAHEQIVINSHVLHSIIKALRVPLSMKYSCPSQMTWKLAVNSLLKVLHAGLPVARQYPAHFQSMWIDLVSTFEDFLFPSSILLPTQSLEDQQCDEALDCKIVQLIRDAILPFANQLPREFIIRIVTLLNKGSIHSATGNSPVDIDSSRKLREEFAKACFETLLQFSFFGHEIGKFSDDSDVVNLLAVTSLLQRFQEVICKYADDERLSGKCPLPRHRMSEISFVLKAVATLARSLKKADPEKVEWTVWEQLIALYPHLVDCTTSTSNQVCRSLREALHEYAVLLKPPQQFVNGNPH